jgi:Uma2 family endonuclease
MTIAPHSRARANAPTLEPGDHLARAEFERRYALRPDLHKAELVQGVVYVPSPVRIDDHGSPSSLLITWLTAYAATRPGVKTANDGTVRLSPDDNVQPDAMMWHLGGQAQVDDDNYLAGAPELVVEVAASSASYDLHTKKESYRRAGVKEYIVWRTLDRMIDWFRLKDGQFVVVLPDEEGAIESTVFPGLRLNVARLLAGDATVILPPPAS